jgi:hypothetical protein
MTERADQQICLNAPAHFTALVHEMVWAKYDITAVCQ